MSLFNLIIRIGNMFEFTPLAGFHFHIVYHVASYSNFLAVFTTHRFQSVKMNIHYCVCSFCFVIVIILLTYSCDNDERNTAPSRNDVSDNFPEIISNLSFVIQV